jgi:hypothetical protein
MVLKQKNIKKKIFVHKMIKTSGKKNIIKSKISTFQFIKNDKEVQLFNFEKIRNLKFKNGGKIKIENKVIESSNTCPIDYFLSLVYVLVEDKNYYDNLDPNLKNIFNEINKFLKNNEWDLARYYSYIDRKFFLSQN